MFQLISDVDNNWEVFFQVGAKHITQTDECYSSNQPKSVTKTTFNDDFTLCQIALDGVVFTRKKGYIIQAITKSVYCMPSCHSCVTERDVCVWCFGVQRCMMQCLFPTLWLGLENGQIVRTYHLIYLMHSPLCFQTTSLSFIHSSTTCLPVLAKKQWMNYCADVTSFLSPFKNREDSILRNPNKFQGRVKKREEPQIVQCVQSKTVEDQSPVGRGHRGEQRAVYVEVSWRQEDSHLIQ